MLDPTTLRASWQAAYPKSHTLERWAFANVPKLIEEIERLQCVGNDMADVCKNLSNGFRPESVAFMRELVADWEK